MTKLYKIGYYTLGAALLVFGSLLVLLQTNIIPGFEVRIVQSGSMEPAILTGSVVVVQQLSHYQVGDIITFGGFAPGSTPTTHRIIADTLQAGELAFITQGDANAEADPQPVPLASVRGKVLLTIPYLGFLLDFAREPLGFALLVGVPAALIVFEEVSNILAALRSRRMAAEKAKAGDEAPNTTV